MARQRSAAIAADTQCIALVDDSDDRNGNRIRSIFFLPSFYGRILCYESDLRWCWPARSLFIGGKHKSQLSEAMNIFVWKCHIRSLSMESAVHRCCCRGAPATVIKTNTRPAIALHSGRNGRWFGRCVGRTGRVAHFCTQQNANTLRYHERQLIVLYYARILSSFSFFFCSSYQCQSITPCKLAYLLSACILHHDKHMYVWCV